MLRNIQSGWGDIQNETRIEQQIQSRQLNLPVYARTGWYF